MAHDLRNKYFVSTNGTTWEEVTTKWNGVRVLSIDGFNQKGDAVNVYNEQWINSQTEDFLVTTQDGQGNDVIIRKNVDLNLTLIVSRRYASDTIDEQQVYDSVVDYIAQKGAFYVKSAYTNKYVKVACLKSFKPTTQNLQRGVNSYILVTIPLHTLDEAQSVSPQGDAVDLCLPSGNLWATKNLGATRTSDGGLFYCLGELNGYASVEARNDVSGLESGFSEETYIELNERALDIGTLPLAKDAAHVALGGNWVIPTIQDLQEIVDNCTFSTDEIGGVMCGVFTANNGNTLSFPLCGVGADDNIEGVGMGAYILSSNVLDMGQQEADGWYCNCLGIYVNEGQPTIFTDEPTPIYYGCSIRPVLKTT